MLHDVTLDVYDRLTRSARLVVLTLDADGGDDAAAKALAMARDEIAAHEMFKIIGIAPAAAQSAAAHADLADNADVPDVDAIPEAGTLDEKADLLARLMDAGIPFDRRWGVARLRAALESDVVVNAV